MINDVAQLHLTVNGLIADCLALNISFELNSRIKIDNEGRNYSFDLINNNKRMEGMMWDWVNLGWGKEVWFGIWAYIFGECKDRLISPDQQYNL